jgi:hypothetical protein
MGAGVRRVWNPFRNRRGETKSRTKEACSDLVGELRYRFPPPWTRIWLYGERDDELVLVDIFVQKDSARAVYRPADDEVCAKFAQLSQELSVDGLGRWTAISFSVDITGQYSLIPDYDDDQELGFLARRRRWVARMMGPVEIDYSGG